MLWLTTLTGSTCFFVGFFISRLTVCQAVLFFLPSPGKFVFAILSLFQLILFVLLVFKLIVIHVDVKAAWHFYNGKCSLAVWLCQIL